MGTDEGVFYFRIVLSTAEMPGNCYVGKDGSAKKQQEEGKKPGFYQLAVPSTRRKSKSSLFPGAGAWLQMTSISALPLKMWVFWLLLRDPLILSHLICVSAVRTLPTWYSSHKLESNFNAILTL